MTMSSDINNPLYPSNILDKYAEHMLYKITQIYQYEYIIESMYLDIIDWKSACCHIKGGGNYKH